MKSTHRHILLFSAVLAASMTAQAQETYLNASVATQDLNGTARYVGMGGAMEALGAEISTIGTNPAGIGMFRSSQAKVSFGLVSQEGGGSFDGTDKTKMSFDQAGFVYSMRTGRRSFINFAFNYHKSTNFNHILSATGKLNGDASQNKLTYLKDQKGLFTLYQNKGVITADGYAFGPHDYLNANMLLPELSTNGNQWNPVYTGADGYTFGRAHTGYIGSYDFNISGNIYDRFYWGLTVGIHDVHYDAHSLYTEHLVGADGTDYGNVTYDDQRRITGTGFDVKAGVIFRPVEESPFRIGLSIASPTFYDLKSSYTTGLTNNSTIPNQNVTQNLGVGATDLGYGDQLATYDYCLFTPWKFGLSAGTTIGTMAAIGLSYEFADYSSLDTRIQDHEYSEWADDYFETSSSDDEMNSATKRVLKGVHTLKLGAELKPTNDLAVRVGYNYVSPMYRKEATKSAAIESLSNYYSSTTDYTNWEATNRFTCGVGYTVQRFTIDLAYQYSTQKGKFHPFDNYMGENASEAVKVSNDRHQLLLSLGYKF